MIYFIFHVISAHSQNDENIKSKIVLKMNLPPHQKKGFQSVILNSRS